MSKFQEHGSLLMADHRSLRPLCLCSSNAELNTQHNSFKNAITPITPSYHDMFRPQTAIFKSLSYAKTLPLSTYSHHMQLRYFMI
jgi:hypothetical protein